MNVISWLLGKTPQPAVASPQPVAAPLPAIQLPSPPIAPPVVEPVKEETDQEKWIRFEKLMKEFKVPLDVFLALKNKPCEVSDLSTCLLQRNGDRLNQPDLQVEAIGYSAEIKKLRQLMQEFKNKSVDISNFEPWPLVFLLASEIWEGEQLEKLVLALKEKTFNAPDFTNRCGLPWPNLFITKTNLLIFLKHIEYAKLNEEEKNCLFKRIKPDFLIDPSFIQYCLDKLGESIDPLLSRIQLALESIIDRYNNASRGAFEVQITWEDRFYGRDYECKQAYFRLAAVCYENEKLTNESMESLENKEDFQNFLNLMKVLREIALISKNLPEGQQLSQFLKTHATTSYAFSKFEKKFYLLRYLDDSQSKTFAMILKDNPQWFSHFAITDLLLIDKFLPFSELQKRVLPELKNQIDFRLTYTSSQLQQLEKLVPSDQEHYFLRTRLQNAKRAKQV